MTNDTNTTGITIRRLGPADDAAVERLVQLDSGNRPSAPLMGAEIEGRLLVATSIETGKSVADPFSRTAELRSLVEMQDRPDQGQRPSVEAPRTQDAVARSPGRLTPRRRRQAPHAPGPPELTRVDRSQAPRERRRSASAHQVPGLG